MEQKSSPLLLSFLVLVLLLPLGILPRLKPQGPSEAESKKPAHSAQSTEAQAPKPSGTEADIWSSVARFYGEYFGLESQGKGEAPIRHLFDTVKGRSPERGPRYYELKFVIAFVPDPIDSHLPMLFDQALEGIQQAYADSDYLLDRFWLPWASGGTLGTDLHRRVPGLLLFRKTKDEPDRNVCVLVTVLLVGESPKSGIQKEAFRRAVRISVLGGAPEISIVGPSFSGSIESVRLALNGFRRSKRLDTPPSPMRFELVTGTATAPGLEQELAEFGSSATLCRTVVPDDRLLETALRHLEKERGWDRRRLLLLTEADTGYGQIGSRENRKISLANFPSGIADVRSAWEQKGEHQGSGQQGAIAVPKSNLDLSLEGHGEPRDVIPRFDPLSIADNDLALSSLLRTISHERIRYVGIMATDVRDKIFLAERVHRHSPDALLFTLENDLLYGHPEVGQKMNGMLVLSNFPLYTAGQKGLPMSGAAYLRQSSSEFQQGFFKATRYVSAYPRNLEPPRTSNRRFVWISAVRNGAVWPVVRILAPVSDLKLCTTTESWELQAGERATKVRASAERKDLQIMFFMAFLYFLCSLLDRITVPPAAIHDLHSRLGCRVELQARLAWRIAQWLRTRTDAPLWGRICSSLEQLSKWQGRMAEWNARWVAARIRELILAVSLLWVAASVVLFLGLFPLKLNQGNEISTLLALGLPLLYGLFVWRLGLLSWPYFTPAVERAFGRLRWVPFALWGGIAVLLPVALAWLLNKLWALGENELMFFFRAQAFASGLSPLVSLFWGGLALYLWSLLELRRLQLLVRAAPEWPLHQSWEPVLRSLPNAADQLGRFLLDTRLPEDWLKIGLFIVVVPPMVLLWHIVQPISESMAYGRILLVLCLSTLTLGAIAFYRFLRIWQMLRRILERLEHTSLIKALGRLSPRLGWTPMRSFWEIPTFNVVLLSVRRIELIDRYKRFPLGAFRDQVNLALDEAFEAMRSGPPRVGDRKAIFCRELVARRKIQTVFEDLGRFFMDLPRDPLVESYFAVRIVSYVRHCFLHMRNCLIAALACGICTLVAVSTYAFEPKQFLSLVLWLLLAGMVAVTISIFVQMDRNAVLSAIGGSEPGKVRFDRVFVLNVLTYGFIPLLSIIATQFPDLGIQFLRWINPALRVAGID